MDILTHEEAAEWWRERGLRIEGRPYFSSTEAERTFRLKVPSHGRLTVSMAYMMLMSGVEDHLEAHYAGGLLWFLDWNIGSETYERVGLSLLQGLRGVGRVDDIGQRPALAFGPSELAAANAAMTLPLLFQWDAWYVPRTGGWIAAISHDGYVDMETDTAEKAAVLAERFGPGGWLM